MFKQRFTAESQQDLRRRLRDAGADPGRQHNYLHLRLFPSNVSCVAILPSLPVTGYRFDISHQLVTVTGVSTLPGSVAKFSLGCAPETSSRSWCMATGRFVQHRQFTDHPNFATEPSTSHSRARSRGIHQSIRLARLLRRVRRVRGGDRAGQGAAARDERANSIGMDAHKWFFQPYEAGGPSGEGHQHAQGRLLRPPRCHSGHDMGSTGSLSAPPGFNDKVISMYACGMTTRRGAGPGPLPERPCGEEVDLLGATRRAA